MTNLLSRVYDATKDAVIGDVDNDKINGVLYASPGEVAATISDANTADVGIGHDKARRKVSLQSGDVYDEGAEVTVPPGVILDGNNANLGNSQNAGDHNILFVDNGAEVRNLKIGINGGTYTSDAIVLDTSRTTHGRYALGAATGPDGTAIGGREGRIENVKIIGDINSSPGGVGVAFRDSASEGIFVGTRCDIRVFRMNVGVELDSPADDGSGATGVNFDPSAVSAVGCTTLINHVGAQPARTPLTGHLQPAGPTEYGIRNQTSQGSVSFEGVFFDPQNAATNALAGPDIRVNCWQHLNTDWLTYSDGSDGQLVTHYQPFSQRLHYQVPTDANDWVHNFKFGNRRWSRNGTIEFDHVGNGNIKAETGSFEATTNGDGVVSTSPDGNTTTTWNTQNDGTWG